MEISNITKNRIKETLKEGKRFDGRKLDEFRDIKIELGISKNAEGSAKVIMGNTEVLVGIKLDVGTPYTDHEDEGTLITTAELLPLASPRFEPGPPRIESIELARLVDRGIRESKMIDFKKLCIKKGEKVFNILIDIYAWNYDGNLIDASCLAAVAALRTAKMPKYDEKNEVIKFGEFTSKPLPLNDIIPITVTCHKIGNQILVDPVLEEEESSEARLTLAMATHKKDEIFIHAGQKGGEEVLDEKEIEKMIDIAAEKFKELESKILKLK